MNASDAKESISQGGSLKDRMAALQGKGAFGQPAPPPPKPSSDKPKWKPPPKPVSPPQEENEASFTDLREPVVSKPSGDDSVPKESGGEVDVGEDAGETEPDAEEEERQRRAAIAARMARLGGARVGMAPPVFGKKPSIKKPKEPESAEESRPLEPAGDGMFAFNLIVMSRTDI
jgi:myosin tail region-interacting protein MTI1